MSDVPIFFEGEVQMAGWRDSHTNGPMVTFRLADSEALEVFRDATIAKGNQAGDRYQMVLVKLGDDEQPEPPSAKTKLGPYCITAIGLCKREDFRRWVGERQEWAEPATVEGARQYILDMCGVDSRKRLDDDATAALMFRDRIERPFLRWSVQQKVVK